MVKAIYEQLGPYLGMTLREFEVGFMRDACPEIDGDRPRFVVDPREQLGELAPWRETNHEKHEKHETGNSQGQT